MNKLFVLLLLVFVSSCGVFTKHKALKILNKEMGSAPMASRYFDKYEYPNGSVGYDYNYGLKGSGFRHIFEDTLYTLELSHRFHGNQQACVPVPGFEGLIGYIKAGKCEGRWYTYIKYRAPLTDSCEKKFIKYGGEISKHGDFFHAVFVRLNKLETYKAGFLDGNFICYDFDGKIIYTTKFVKGTGYYKHFSPDDGLLKEEGQYINGYKDGKWGLYYRNSDGPTDTIITFYKKGIQMER
jgi:antitoxin component YwqK of YwqJK toxin-antitoxin module